MPVNLKAPHIEMKGRQDVCTKCQLRGRPRQGHFDKKSRSEKRKLLLQVGDRIHFFSSLASDAKYIFLRIV
jgi:hypothetical protein